MKKNLRQKASEERKNIRKYKLYPVESTIRKNFSSKLSKIPFSVRATKKWLNYWKTDDPLLPQTQITIDGSK